MRRAILWLLVVVTVVCGQKENAEGQIEVRWGIADTAATVGRLFRMHVPGDAFQGPVKSYTVKTADGDSLPSWLYFDPNNNILEGIPTPSDAGQTFLELTANGPNIKSQASVTFSLLVRDVASHTAGAPLRFKSSSQSSGAEFVRCRQSEPETVATLVLDTDLDSLDVYGRVALLRSFLQHMGLHEEMVKMVPVAGRPMQDGSALVSGVGDTPHPEPQTSGTFVSWAVGCGQVKEGHFPALQRLDDDSANGQMANALACPVIGWHVTNSRLQAPKRKRRAAGYQTATPVITPVMPTKTKAATDDDMTDKMTHTVVDRVSPTFIQPTATQTMDKTDLPTPGGGKVTPPAVTSKPMEPKPTPPLPPMKKTEEMIKPTKTMDTTMKPTDSAELTPKPPVIGDDCVKNQPPMLKKAMTDREYFVGAVIDITIPEDTFEDCEIGGTRNLHLSLYKDTTTMIPKDFFMKFNKEKQRIIGLPGSENIGKYRFNLVASKNNELRNNANFTIEIKPLGTRDSESINHELSAKVDYDYNEFMQDVEARMQLSNNIASLFGDPDSRNMLVTKLEPGSVVYAWTNKTLNSGGCPTGDVGKLVSKMVNSDGTLTKEAIKKMEPFTLLSMGSQPAGACEGNPNFPVAESLPRTDLEKPDGTGTDKPTMKPKGDDKTTKEPGDGDLAKGSTGDDDDDDKLLTTVIPGVVIVLVLVIGLIIGCVLYRRKRKGNMNVEEKNTFINQHPPVIFPDELEEKPSSEVNKPLLLSDNGDRANTSAAGPPPEYHRGPSESPERPPNSNNGGALVTNGRHDDVDDITEMPERYDPPPPVTSTGGSGKNPKPAHQPFSQPPQILP